MKYFRLVVNWSLGVPLIVVILACLTTLVLIAVFTKNEDEEIVVKLGLVGRAMDRSFSVKKFKQGSCFIWQDARKLQ